MVSFFVYLALPDGGGRTAFPQLAESFQPAAGGALVWYNLDRHGVPDARTLHAGEPVVCGEKWGMNIWLRERPMQRRVRQRVTVRLQLLPGCRVVAALAVAAPAAHPSYVSDRATERCCSACRSVTSPLGLCLCKSSYEGSRQGADPDGMASPHCWLEP